MGDGLVAVGYLYGDLVCSRSVIGRFQEEFLAFLKDELITPKNQLGFLPRRGAELAKRLMELAPLFREVGIVVERLPRTGKTRPYRVYRMDPQNVGDVDDSDASDGMHQESSDLPGPCNKRDENHQKVPSLPSSPSSEEKRMVFIHKDDRAVSNGRNSTFEVSIIELPDEGAGAQR